MLSRRATEVLTYVAANAQRLRIRRGLTQQQVTDLVDLDLRHYRRIERGTENITMETLVALADAFDVPPAALLRKARLIPARTGRPTGRGRS
jgi:transcriptional regulator with XRE-family HTH domain